MKYIYTFLILLLPLFVFSQTIAVDFTVTNLDAENKKLFEVKYCAEGNFTQATGRDDWGGQVITLGFKPSVDIGSGFPNQLFTDFESSIFSISDGFGGGDNINTFTIEEAEGDTNDGNRYASFTGNSAIFANILDGECVVAFSFKLPIDLGTFDTTEVFLANENFSPIADLRVNIGNNGAGGNVWNGEVAETALPIELLSFQAEKLNKKSAHLSWATASEINSSHFDVERSVDGRNWDLIGQVKASTQSTSIKKYELNDLNISTEVRRHEAVYYRLRMMDIDESFKYSDVELVKFFGSTKADVVVFPNPTMNNFEILSDLNIKNIKVYDSAGKIIIDEVYRGGIYTIGNYPSDLYNIILETETGDVISKKVIKTN